MRAELLVTKLAFFVEWGSSTDTRVLELEMYPGYFIYLFFIYCFIVLLFLISCASSLTPWLVPSCSHLPVITRHTLTSFSCFLFPFPVSSVSSFHSALVFFTYRKTFQLSSPSL